MKNLLIIISFLSCYSLIAQKSYDLKFNLVDSYHNKPLANCKVTIIGEEGDIIYSASSNDKGLLLVEKIKSKKIFIICNDEKDYFFEHSFNFKGGKNKDEQVKVYLFPTPKYEALMFQIEDSIYGEVVKSSNFDDTDDSSILDSMLDSIVNGVYTEASFPGGASEMQLYIAQNVIYPQKSIEMNEQGKVYVEFVVEKNGTISHVKILKGASLSLNNEAKRLIRFMPNWTPGKDENSETARTLCKVPINFTLR